MKKLNLEVAGDFVAMAATLIQIKAKMLVPQYDEEGEVLEEEDPRKDLVRRLLEYQAFQDAGKRLYDRSLVGRDVLLRGKRESIEAPEGELIIEEDKKENCYLTQVLQGDTSYCELVQDSRGLCG